MPSTYRPQARDNRRRTVWRYQAFILSSVIVAASFSIPTAASGAVLLGAPATVPIITAPADGATVSTANVAVSATSTAPVVKFVLDSRGGAFTKDVTVSGDTAASTLPVFGLDGATQLEAFDCDALGVCNSVGDSVSITIDLPQPVLTSPNPNQVVGNSFEAAAQADQGAIEFRVDGATKAVDLSDPYRKTINIPGLSEGVHTLRAVQCDASGDVCEGPISYGIQFIKETRGPNWSQVDASPGKVFPFRDHYQDTTKLSARLGEKAHDVRLEIRRKDGPVVRTFKLGRESAGRVSVRWNGRQGNGDVVRPGAYTFRFTGEDTHDVASKSNDSRVEVSDKRLVRRSVNKVVSARSSIVGDGSGRCGGVFSLQYPQARYDWPHGLGYYSRINCNGTATEDVALGIHKIRLADAVRYGSISIDTYGAGAFRHPGPATLLYLRSNDTVGVARKLAATTRWHSGPNVSLERYVKNGTFRWAIGTQKGNWYDVKDFRFKYSYSVLRSP